MFLRTVAAATSPRSHIVQLSAAATNRAARSRRPCPIPFRVRRLSSEDNGHLKIFGAPLEVKPWPFNAVLIDSDTAKTADSSEFSTRLLVTIQKVHLLNGHLLSVLGTYGFRLHHTEPEYCYLNLWLGHPSQNRIPEFATHLVGVAGLVLNDDKEVLLVKEKAKQIAGWKLPGGFVNLGEDFGDAACREVKEETGVDCIFSYVITRLTALNTEIDMCEEEIVDAKWMPIADFRKEAAQPVLRIVAELTRGMEDSEELGSRDIVETEHNSIVPGRPRFKLYHAALEKAP